MSKVPSQPTDQSKKLAEEVRPLVERLFNELDTLSYYQLLGVGREASSAAVQQAFYRRAVQLHPDRHFRLNDPIMKRRIAEVYKRIAESYRVLCSSSLRRLYDEGLRRGENRIKQRAFEDEKTTSSDHSTPEITNSSSKELYDQALVRLHKHDFPSAIDLLNQAHTLDPDSEIINQKLKDAQRLQKLWEGLSL